jgi:hypothetical protein
MTRPPTLGAGGLIESKASRSELRQAAGPPLVELFAQAGIGIDAAARLARLIAAKSLGQMLDYAAIL